MKNEVSKALWLVNGILLLFVGIVAAIAGQGERLEAVAFVIGLAMILAGALDILLATLGRGTAQGEGWLLQEGVLSLLMGLLLLSQMVDMAAVGYMFAMWGIICGIPRAAASLRMRARLAGGWCWVLLAGLLQILAGVAAFLKPVAGFVPLGIAVGGILLLHGVNSLMLWAFVKPLGQEEKEIQK